VTDTVCPDVTLVIPDDLISQSANEIDLPANQRLLPALERCIARSNLSVSTVHQRNEILFTLFSIGVANENLKYTSDLPIGAVSYYLQHQVDIERWYMRADPVYIMPNRDHLQLLGNSGLELQHDEAQHIIDEINRCYSDAEWKLRFLSPRQWVLEQAKPIKLSTHSLLDAVGGNLHDYLPEGEDAKRWRNIMNELQMFLYSLPINRQREMQGQFPVNSLWFWGVGKLPLKTDTKINSEYAQCWSSNLFALALAKLCAIPRCDIPEHGDSWLSQVVTPGRHLLVFDEFDPAIMKADPVYSWQLLKTFEERWMRPFMLALQSGRIKSITLTTDLGRNYYLTRAMNKRWWKRRKIAG